MRELKLFAGSSCPELAKDICKELGVSLSPIETYNYRTGCFEVGLNDNVRGSHVFIVQTSIPQKETLHWQLWELLEMVSAAKKASAEKITVVMPYCAYARSDRKWRGRIPITGKLLATFLETAGMDRILGIDFHSHQFEGFFQLKTVVDLLRTIMLIVGYLQKGLDKNTIILPGDEGFRKEADDLADCLKIEVGRVEKKRINADKVKVHSIKGDVKGKRVIITDDEICTAGTMREIIEKLETRGAKSVTITVSHGLFQGNAIKNLQHPLINEIIVTDTVPVSDKIKGKLPLIVIPIAPLLASAIKEIHEGGSISKLFE